MTPAVAQAAQTQLSPVPPPAPTAQSGGDGEAKPDLLAFASFPQPHRRQLWSTKPLEWTNEEIKRRTDIDGIFPNPEALLRLAGAVLVEQHAEWAGSARRHFFERSMTLLAPITDTNGGGQVSTPELISA